VPQNKKARKAKTAYCHRKIDTMTKFACYRKMKESKVDIPLSIQLSSIEPSDSSSSENTLQLEAMKVTMSKMENTIMEQNLQMKQIMAKQSEQMDFVVKTLTLREEEDDEYSGPVPIDCGSYEILYGSTTWSIAGVSSCEPDPDHVYFPGLAWRAKTPTDQRNDKIISAIIPCYNEEGAELERTIRGLSRQIMPEGWRIEAVIVMDGVSAMSDSMAEYLSTIFGVHFKQEDPKKDPFKVLPQAHTIIVHPLDKAAAYTRWPVIEGTVGGVSLVVKRENRRKANSQQWWLGPHSTAIGCKYALATDCGTFFERKTVKRLIQRLDDEVSTHAVTGTQRTMPADLQGDGDFEFIHNPFNFILRMLQRFEFEVRMMCFADSFSFKLWPVRFSFSFASCIHFLRWTMSVS
jgi:hypothetical protein